MATDITIRFEDPHDADAFMHAKRTHWSLLGILADNIQIIDVAGDTPRSENDNVFRPS